MSASDVEVVLNSLKLLNPILLPTVAVAFSEFKRVNMDTTNFFELTCFAICGVIDDCCKIMKATLKGTGSCSQSRTVRLAEIRLKGHQSSQDSSLSIQSS